MLTDGERTYKTRAGYALRETAAYVKKVWDVTEAGLFGVIIFPTITVGTFLQEYISPTKNLQKARSKESQLAELTF